MVVVLQGVFGSWSDEHLIESKHEARGRPALRSTRLTLHDRGAEPRSARPDPPTRLRVLSILRAARRRDPLLVRPRQRPRRWRSPGASGVRSRRWRARPLASSFRSAVRYATTGTPHACCLGCFTRAYASLSYRRHVGGARMPEARRIAYAQTRKRAGQRHVRRARAQRGASEPSPTSTRRGRRSTGRQAHAEVIHALRAAERHEQDDGSLGRVDPLGGGSWS